MKRVVPNLVLTLCLTTFLSAVSADLLDCDSEFARDKVSFDLGSINGEPLQLIACTDGFDHILGRAYLSWADEHKKQQIQDLPPGFGGCGAKATYAIRADNDVLVSTRTCQSRDYHPLPSWMVSNFHWDERSGQFVETKLKPKE